MDLFLENMPVFIVLLLRLGLVGFRRVSRVKVTDGIRTKVRFSFSDKVGIAFPDME